MITVCHRMIPCGRSNTCLAKLEGFLILKKWGIFS